MNLEHLRTFLVVCSCGNFSEAAKILFVPQPTISNRIQYLEEELGQKLFVRGKRGVTLTEAGETFLPYAQQIVNIISSVTSILNAVPQENKFKIGSTIPFTYPLIFEKIQELCSMHTNLNIVLLNVAQNSIMDKLSTREIDAAFVVEPIFQKGIECHRIGEERIELIVSSRHRYLIHQEHPIQPNHLEDETLVCYEPYYGMMRSHILMKINRKGKLITNQIGVVKQLVIQNKGITFLPPYTVKTEVERGELINIPMNIGFETIQYYLVYRQNERYYEDILLKDMSNEMLHLKI